MLYIALALVLLPFVFEGTVKAGFETPDVKRHWLFYILTPITSVLVFLSLAALLGHPVIACVGWLFVYAGLTVVSNVKNKVLGEPLDSPDLETARHLFIYPEFYIDYVGAARVFSVFGSFALAVLASVLLETPIMASQTLVNPYLGWLLGLVGWVTLMAALAVLAAQVFTDARARRLGVTYDVRLDTARFGLFPQMLIYAVLLLDRTSLRSIDRNRPSLKHNGILPDLIALQAESYFDLDRLYPLVEGCADYRWEKLAALRANGAATGQLDVPAWGASTMQSEFAFQSGLANSALGVDRINPYQRAAYEDVTTITTRLKALGYRTICVHPAKKEFFRRSTVIPKLGFDTFIGLEAFDDAPRFGPYVSDQALGDKIEAIIREHKAASSAPVFIFTITIESHGPWDPGRLADWIDEQAAEDADPTRHRGFALFRRHMDHALDLFARLGPEAGELDRPRALALYGDHQPAFQPLFNALGFTGDGTDYILWRSGPAIDNPGPLKVENLADTLLALSGFEESDQAS